MSENIAVGIDVIRETLAACWNGQELSFANDDRGHEVLIAHLSACAIELIAIKSSGSHSTACAYALQAAGFAVALVNARQVTEFANSMTYLPKTDRIDARVLERFATMLAAHPDRHKHVRAMPGEELRGLQALIARRRQLAEMLAAERDRFASSHRAARPSIEILMRAIQLQVEAIEKQMSRHLPSTTPVWLGSSMGSKAQVSTLPPWRSPRNWAASAHAK